MDAGALSKCIKAMIGDRDRVAVPGLGVFHARMMPARYSDNRSTIYPPYRTVFFRQEEVQEGEADELLRHVVSASGITADQAETELSWCVGRIMSELSASGACSLPGFGQMKANSRGDLFFVPEDDLDIWPDGLGLEPVCIKINPEEPEQMRDLAPAAVPAAVPATAPVPEPDPSPASSPVLPSASTPAAARRRPALWISLCVLAAAILFLLAMYLLKDELQPVSGSVTGWIDNLLNRILYNAEERELLGF